MDLPYLPLLKDLWRLTGGKIETGNPALTTLPETASLLFAWQILVVHSYDGITKLNNTENHHWRVVPCCSTSLLDDLIWYEFTTWHILTWHFFAVQQCSECVGGKTTTLVTPFMTTLLLQVQLGNNFGSTIMWQRGSITCAFCHQGALEDSKRIPVLGGPGDAWQYVHPSLIITSEPNCPIKFSRLNSVVLRDDPNVETWLNVTESVN